MLEWHWLVNTNRCRFTLKERRFEMKDCKVQTKTLALAMICGILGCFCYGGGDWLMMYGDPSHTGKLIWLTNGVAQLPAWRNGLAMMLAFSGIILYGIALFYLGRFIRDEKEKKIYHYLNAFGLTPWMCLHLFYIMILYLYAWMIGHGYADAALPACEALFDHLSWVIIVSEVVMLPVFLYWFYVVVRGKTTLPRWMAAGNVLVFYCILYVIKSILPDTAFRLGFTNGLMSESMIFFFILIWILGSKTAEK